MALLYRCAGSLTAQNGGFRPARAVELRGLLPRRRRRRPRQPAPPRHPRRRRVVDHAAGLLQAGGLLRRVLGQGLSPRPAARLRLPGVVVRAPSLPDQVRLPARGALPEPRQVRPDGLPLRDQRVSGGRAGPGCRRRGRAVRRPHLEHAGRVGRRQPLPAVLPRRGLP